MKTVGITKSTGKATIYLELDRVRGRAWGTNGRVTQRTGWARLLWITRNLHRERAHYSVRYEITEPAKSWDVFDYHDADVIPLCDKARLRAEITWETVAYRRR